MNREPKQVIVVRKDLNMRKGKIAAQVAHASMKVLLDEMSSMRDGLAVDSGDCLNDAKVDMRYIYLHANDPLTLWLEGKFTKICVYVESEEELLDIYKKAIDNGVLTSLIQDAGLTEFGGVPTYTCVAVGPDLPEVVDVITGKLKLL